MRERESVHVKIRHESGQDGGDVQQVQLQLSRSGSEIALERLIRGWPTQMLRWIEARDGAETCIRYGGRVMHAGRKGSLAPALAPVPFSQRNPRSQNAPPGEDCRKIYS